MNPRALLIDPKGLWPNIFALAYITFTYFGGWAALVYGTYWSLPLGVLLVAHGMIIAAYLMHDCAHNALFKKTAHNTLLGRWLNMITGANYGTYEDVRYKHMRHHVDNSDLVTFDYRSFLKRHPLLMKTFRALEWMYIPAVELLMHAMLILVPFIYESRKQQRGRVIKVFVIRTAIFATIAWFFPFAALGYVIAYIIFLTTLRFMDAFQHDYELFYTLADKNFVPPYKGDRQYEEEHTYTNLLSEKHPWVNLLTLNFAYHNAHHTKPNLPWYDLPKYHQELYPEGCPQQVGIWDQMKCFHKNRVPRILSEEYGEESIQESIKQGKAVGVDGVSFLTAF
jgi:fatty acid desaturase